MLYFRIKAYDKHQLLVTNKGALFEHAQRVEGDGGREEDAVGIRVFFGASSSTLQFFWHMQRSFHCRD